MGWLKVAETLMNPFGEDDDDFEVNNMIDRNLQSSYEIVDKLRNETPKLTRDIKWDDIPIQLNDSNGKMLLDTSNNNDNVISIDNETELNSILANCQNDEN